MGAQDKIERTLKQIHVMFSEGPIIAGNPDKVVVDKKEVFAILEQLNLAMYEMMDEYEATSQARELAQRRSEKKGEELLSRISKQADDVYAASLIYTDNALNQVQKLMEEAMSASQSALRRLNAEMERERKRVKGDQRELQAQLRDFKESNKYLNIIDRYNKERQKKEKEKQIQQGKKEPEKRIQNEAKHYALNEMPEIRVNPAYFERRRRKAEIEERDKNESEATLQSTAEEKQRSSEEAKGAEGAEQRANASTEAEQTDRPKRPESKIQEAGADAKQEGDAVVNIEELEGLLLLSLEEEEVGSFAGGEEVGSFAGEKEKVGSFAGEEESGGAVGEGKEHGETDAEETKSVSSEVDAEDSFDWNEIELEDDSDEGYAKAARIGEHSTRLSAADEELLPSTSLNEDEELSPMMSSIEDEELPPMPSSIEDEEPEPFVMPEIKVDLDAEYFKWRAQEQEAKNGTDDAAEEDASVVRKKERRFLFGKR